MLVQDGGYRLVLEGLVGHDVAPVAGGVANGDEDRAVELAGEVEDLRAVGVPVHRVVTVLDQVGREVAFGEVANEARSRRAAHRVAT